MSSSEEYSSSSEASSDSDYDYDELYGEGGPVKGNNLERLASRITLTEGQGPSGGHHYEALSNPKLDKDRNQHTDRANRAVTEQVLDARTRMILLKMINKGVIYEVSGCISTGKEANVYLTSLEEHGVHAALKIYKTSILTFKTREKYVTGEFRFRKGYSKSNPRKMVQVWAEKEFRNLKRLQVAGIPSPEPLFLKMHVLLMSLVGDLKQGLAAPRLKDARLAEEEAQSAYGQCLRIMRRLYQQCHLVHADFSEYNLLWFQGKIHVIDVSQSVEHDHPRALDFLRMDCANTIRFFRQTCSLSTLTPRQLFDFCTTIGDLDAEASFDSVESYLDKAHLEAPSLWEQEGKNTDAQVFQQVYIPRTLDEVPDVEKDLDKLKKGQELLYGNLTGLGAAKMGKAKIAEDESEEFDSASGSDSSSVGEEEEGESEEGEGNLTREEKRARRKENKALVKAEKKEKRKTKIPKHVKKRKEKIAHRH